MRQHYKVAMNSHCHKSGTCVIVSVRSAGYLLVNTSVDKFICLGCFWVGKLGDGDECVLGGAFW